MSNKGLADRIYDLVQAEAGEFGLFLVDWNASPGNILLRFYMDSVAPLNMADLSKFSRHVNQLIDEGDFGDKKFTIEISSPGADRPLQHILQYSKHIGRTFEITTAELQKAKLILRAVNEDMLEFEKKPEKKPKGEVNEAVMLHIPFSEIQEALIVIAFN